MIISILGLLYCSEYDYKRDSIKSQQVNSG